MFPHAEAFTELGREILCSNTQGHVHCTLYRVVGVGSILCSHTQGRVQSWGGQYLVFPHTEACTKLGRAVSDPLSDLCWACTPEHPFLPLSKRNPADAPVKILLNILALRKNCNNTNNAN